MALEFIPFSPRFDLANYENVFDGKTYNAEPTARLTFPDETAALKFINSGSDPNYRHIPVTLDYLQCTHEAPVGPHNQYDAFTSRPDQATGEVNMTIRHYGPHGPEWHGELSDFVMGVIGRMSEERSQNLSASG